MEIEFYAVDLANKLGAEYAEARIERRYTSNILYRNGRVEAYGYGISYGIGIRVLVNGGLAFTSTNILDKNNVERIIRDAVKIAKNASKHATKPIKMSDEKLVSAKWESKFKQNPFDVSLEEKIELFKVFDSILKDIGIFPSRSYNLSTGFLEKRFINSEGIVVEGKRMDTHISYSIIAFKPGKGSVYRRNSFAGTVGWELIRDEKPEKYLMEEAKKMQEILDKATKPPINESLDIVLGSEVVGLMVHESCGHPSEADRIMGREAAQAGESYMKPDMLGKRIGTSVVNICDDPTIPKSYGFYLYDDEGVKARKRELFKNGYINEFLHNRETAAIFGVNSNGSARASSYNREPIIRMANTYFVPGDYSLEELIEDVHKGVYIKSYMEWNIDDRRWSQRYVGLEAYLIENGELKGLVKNPALEITTGGLYSSIDAVGKDLKFYPGTCGKGDPGQGVPVWFGGPSIRLRNVRLSISL